jgi:spore coat protein U domain-containing protein, fimbrial subunit CupE1/2/3/6
VAVVLGAALLAAGGSAGAGIVTSGFQVSATVAPRCTIVASNLAFGVYDPFVANAQVGLDAAATLTVTCTRGAVGAIAVDAGLNGGPEGSVRQMVSGSQRLTYQIFKDPSRTTVWRAGADGATVINAGGAEAPERVTLFARIPPSQVVLSGRYADTVTATMQF